jgi:ABC-2 type transport system permease protein
VSRLRAPLTVAGVELLRLSRDKIALFFLIVLPFALILALGSAFPTDGSRVTVGVVAAERDGLSGALLDDLRSSDRLRVEDYDDVRALARDVRMGQLDGAVVLPRDLDDAVRAGRAALVRVEVDPANQSSAVVRGVVGSLVEDRALVITSTRFAQQAGVDAARAGAAARGAVEELDRASVRTVTVGDGTEVAAGTFAFVAMAQLVLFMFINALAGGGSLVEMRTYGVASRAMSAPVRVGDLVGGLTAARYAIALVQGLLIVLVSTVAFDVEWGDAAVVVVVVALFALVAAGAGVLTGALARSADQAAAIGVPLALAMAALGGCFFPLSLAPPAMQAVARITPHAWATEALSAAMFDGASLGAVAGNVAVLAGFAVVLVTLGVVALRRRLLHPGD